MSVQLVQKGDARQKVKKSQNENEKTVFFLISRALSIFIF
jgi:hypothetical protein